MRDNRTFSPDRHRRQTQIRLAVAGFLVLLIVGGGLAWLIYGPAAGFVAVLCLLAGAAVLCLLWLILSLLERWVQDDDV